MKSGEKSQVIGKGNSDKPCCPEHIPRSIQTHVLPGVEKPTPPEHTGWITTRSIS